MVLKMLFIALARRVHKKVISKLYSSEIIWQYGCMVSWSQLSVFHNDQWHLRDYNFTAHFNNTWTLKFKSQLMFPFFTAINHLSRSLGKQNFTSNQFKSSRFLWLVDWWILIHFCVFVFQGPLLAIMIMMDNSKKRIIISWPLNFRVCLLLKSAVNLFTLSQ